jgi:hypothetical protein
LSTFRIFVGVVIAVRALLEGGRAAVELDLDTRSWCGNDETEGRRDNSKKIEELHIEDVNPGGK